MHHEEQFCEIMGQWFRRRYRLKDLLFEALAVLLFDAAEPFMQILVEGIMRNNCEIILNLGQWFRRCLKDFLSGALTAEPFMQF